MQQLQRDARWLDWLTLGVFALVLAASLAVASPLFGTPPVYGPYRLHVIRVVDGDTIDAEVALWPGLSQRTLVRLAGVNAPEIRTRDDCERNAGRAATAFVTRTLQAARRVELDAVDLDKYGGRVVGLVYVDGRSLGELLVQAGHARPYDGGARGSWCSP
jgi:endonuclease YncB( thermonuclease family)